MSRRLAQLLLLSGVGGVPAAPVLTGPLSLNGTTGEGSYSSDIAARHYWMLSAPSSTPSADEIAAGDGALVGDSASAFGFFDAAIGTVEADITFPEGINVVGGVFSVAARVEPSGPWSNVLRDTSVDVNTVNQPISSIAADGWQAIMISPSDLAFAEVAGQRQGYDQTAAAVTIAETLFTGKRVRQAHPNAASLKVDGSVALTDYALSTDSFAGVTNNSAEISPKPCALHLTQDRLLVGNTISGEVMAFHYYARSRRQVACMRARATDGTNTTAWVVVSGTNISSYAEDANPIEVYAWSIDITALNTGLITVQFEVMPWIGASASVLASADQSARREFSHRYFLKNVSRAASPPLAYVSSTGNNTTGVWSTNAATAAATPFLTVGGALQALDDGVRGTPATGGVADGCRIRIVNTVDAGTTTTSRPQNIAGVIVERAPGTARASAIVTHGADMRCRLGVGTLTAPLTEGCIIFNDMSFNRTGAFTFLGEAATQLDVRVHNVAWTSSSAATARSNSHLSLYGVTFPNLVPSIGNTTGLDMRLVRGCTGDLNNAGRELFNEIGNIFTRASSSTVKDPTKPMIRYNNLFRNPNAASTCVTFAGSVAGQNLGAIVDLQNFIECTHTTTSTASVAISADSANGNITHAIIGYNGETGRGSIGRRNMAYDETVGTARNHKFIRMVGNIFSQLNVKGDEFLGDGSRLGHLALDHGVGCIGNWTQYAPASVTTEAQSYPGRNASIGTSTTVRNAPGFTNYQGTTDAGGAGAGNGNYVLTPSAPARTACVVPDPILAFDLAGNPRAVTNDAPGPYA